MRKLLSIFAIAVVLAGVAVSPSLISAFTLAELLVPRCAVTEAFTWIGTALGLGVALGASVAGKVVETPGPPLFVNAATRSKVLMANCKSTTATAMAIGAIVGMMTLR